MCVCVCARMCVCVCGLQARARICVCRRPQSVSGGVTRRGMPSCAKRSQLAATKQLVSLDKLPPAPGQTGNKTQGPGRKSAAGPMGCEVRRGRGEGENSLEEAGWRQKREEMSNSCVGEVKLRYTFSTIRGLSEGSRDCKRERNGTSSESVVSLSYWRVLRLNIPLCKLKIF